MKTLNKTLLALVAGTVVTAGTNAALYQTNTTGYTGQPYVGVKAGQFNTDVDSLDADNQTAYGVYAGYNFTPNFGAEVEYVDSSKEDLKYSGTKVGEISTNTAGLYGTYKYQFPASNVYAKGKLGIAQTQVDDGDDKYDESGLAGGVGLGYNLSPNASVEAEYTRLPSVDVTNNVSVDSDLVTVGAHYKF